MGTTPWPPFVIDWTLNEPGIECEFVIDVAKIINASVNVVYSFAEDFGFRTTNGVWTGMDGYLQKKQIDLLVGGLFTNVDRPGDFETSHWYMPNAFTWIVPTANTIPNSRIMWMILTVGHKHISFLLDHR